jgi:hypothetical protein
MTMPEPPAQRKPPRRFWLFAPYILLLAGVGIWSLVWQGARIEVERDMDQAAADLRGQGYVVDWADRRIDGYPYRLDLTVTAPRIIEPSGWGLTATTLKAQAYAYNLDNWIVVAGDGVTLKRPAGGGDVVIKGTALRASLAGLKQSPPRVSIEGVNLSFTPQAGGRPFGLTSTEHLGLHMRPSGTDGAELLLQLTGARAPQEELLGRLTGERSFALIADGVVSRTDALAGRGWPATAKHWATAGGSFSLNHFGMASGPLRLGIGPSVLGLNSDGAVDGDLPLRYAGQTSVDLHLTGGVATVNGAPVGTAPRVY